MATADSVSVCTTMTGLPRRAGASCCSHDAKNALRSRNSHWTAGLALFILCSIRPETLKLQARSAVRAAREGRGLQIHCKKGMLLCDMVVCIFERRGEGRA